MLNKMRNMMKKMRNERGLSTLELIVLLPVYFILIWISFESLFFYSFIIFDGYADVRDEMLERCYKANSETVSTFTVRGGTPIISDLIDLMTIWYPDSDELRFKVSCAGK